MAKKKAAETKVPAQPKPKKPAKASKSSSGVRFPILVEAVYSTAGILMLVVTATVIFLSLQQGIPVFYFLLRVGVTILVLGILLYLFARMIVDGWIKSSLEQMKSSQSTSSNPLPANEKNLQHN